MILNRGSAKSDHSERRASVLRTPSVEHLKPGVSKTDALQLNPFVRRRRIRVYSRDSRANSSLQLHAEHGGFAAAGDKENEFRAREILFNIGEFRDGIDEGLHLG